MIVTAGPAAPRDRSIVPTPAGKADIQVIVIPWWKQTAIRTVRTYLQALVGFLVAGGTGAAEAVGVPLPAGDFLSLLLASAGLSLAPAVIALLQNSVEILARLESPATRA
ncbi:MAG: hypothetical protein ACREF4_02475 [Gammaproteobacteria bacterium]